MPQYRRESFVQGLQTLGYEVSDKISPSTEGVLVIWNRYGNYDRIAKEYERAGGRVVVAENGYLGRDWKGEHWYSLARSFHNGGGWWQWPQRDHKRWESFGVECLPRKKDGEDIVVLATRHIGPEGVCEPRGWAERVALDLCKRTSRKVRVRVHPGENKPQTELLDDLKDARACVTWGSGAALKALLAGVPVFYGYNNWIGGSGARLLTKETDLEETYLMPNPLPMFHRLAWAMWTTEEISTGEPFKCLLA